MTFIALSPWLVDLNIGTAPTEPPMGFHPRPLTDQLVEMLLDQRISATPQHRKPEMVARSGV
jgi:hypothetical protein